MDNSRSTTITSNTTSAPTSHITRSKRTPNGLIHLVRRRKGEDEEGHDSDEEEKALRWKAKSKREMDDDGNEDEDEQPHFARAPSGFKVTQNGSITSSVASTSSLSSSVKSVTSTRLSNRRRSLSCNAAAMKSFISSIKVDKPEGERKETESKEGESEEDKTRKRIQEEELMKLRRMELGTETAPTTPRGGMERGQQKSSRDWKISQDDLNSSRRLSPSSSSITPSSTSVVSSSQSLPPVELSSARSHNPHLPHHHHSPSLPGSHLQLQSQSQSSSSSHDKFRTARKYLTLNNSNSSSSSPSTRFGDWNAKDLAIPSAKDNKSFMLTIPTSQLEQQRSRTVPSSPKNNKTKEERIEEDEVATEEEVGEIKILNDTQPTSASTSSSTPLFTRTLNDTKLVGQGSLQIDTAGPPKQKQVPGTTSSDSFLSASQPVSPKAASTSSSLPSTHRSPSLIPSATSSTISPNPASASSPHLQLHFLRHQLSVVRSEQHPYTSQHLYQAHNWTAHAEANAAIQQYEKKQKEKEKEKKKTKAAGRKEDLNGNEEVEDGRRSSRLIPLTTSASTILSSSSLLRPLNKPPLSSSSSSSSTSSPHSVTSQLSLSSSSDNVSAPTSSGPNNKNVTFNTDIGNPTGLQGGDSKLLRSMSTRAILASEINRSKSLAKLGTAARGADGGAVDLKVKTNETSRFAGHGTLSPHLDYQPFEWLGDAIVEHNQAALAEDGFAVKAARMMRAGRSKRG